MSLELKPPDPLWSFGLEAAGLTALPQLALSWASLQAEPRGDGSTVLVLPGFGADDGSTWALRRFLGSRGYTARGWGLGANRASVPEAIDSIGAAAARAAAGLGSGRHRP